jgi:hypothetical protein
MLNIKHYNQPEMTDTFDMEEGRATYCIVTELLIMSSHGKGIMRHDDLHSNS